MIRRILKSVWAFLSMPVFSPRGLACAAGTIVVGFAVCRIAGFDRALSVISGTVPPGMTARAAMQMAAAYVVLWMGVVLVAPPLLIASVILKLLLRRFSPRSQS